MNPIRPSDDEIFERAAELSGEARAAYLAQACGGDEQLRQRVEKLLHAHDHAGTSFMGKPAIPRSGTVVITTNMIPVTEKPGDKIGRYKLREQIGEGGCGVVYVAEQEEPVRRRVALKVIKLGMDTKQVVARFEAERQALALMDHPHIAKVLDAGATDTGRPYFVMELVRGIKITDYCDKNNLSTEERLKLFIQVCSAIQHAHQKGIIHRDIKPSNILVTLHDGTPVPKVIDFGIAKATSDQRLTDKTIYTAFEQFIGTPAYMSPEQAEMSGLDIDTRSDIYSLGVLLYELLTGRTPFDAATLLKAGLDQMRRIIREQEPQRPSTRLSTLEDADLTAVANHRHAEPPKLLNLIRGDLDWIVMKSLEKDRTRRFETVNALATDVKRHLDNEPIVARPPSQLYRVQKLIARNKLAVAAFGAIVGALVLGISVSAWQAIRASREAQRADRNAAQETLQRRRADAAALDARQTLAISDFRQATLLEQEDKGADALAHLQRSLSLSPSNSVAVTRLVMLTSQRMGMIPVTLENTGSDVVSSVHFSPGGKRIITSSMDGTVEVWDAQTGQQAGVPLKHSASVSSAQFSPDAKRILTTSWNTAVVWDAQTSQQVGTPLIHSNQVHSAEFSPDAKRILTFSENTLRVWDAQTGQQVGTPLIHSNQVYSAQFRPDGKRIVTFSRGFKAFVLGSILRVWDAQTGQQVEELFINSHEVDSAQFSPDGKRILTTSMDTLRVWDAQTGQQVTEPLKHPNRFTSAQFSPDGKRIVTTSDERTARVWDVQIGQEVSALLILRHSDQVSDAQFSSDGRQIVTVSTQSEDSGSDSTVQVWDIAPFSENYPDWLLKLAEALSGQLLNRQGTMEPPAQDPAENAQPAPRKLKEQTENDDWPYGAAGFWRTAWREPPPLFQKLRLQNMSRSGFKNRPRSRWLKPRSRLQATRNGCVGLPRDAAIMNERTGLPYSSTKPKHFGVKERPLKQSRSIAKHWT